MLNIYCFSGFFWGFGCSHSQIISPESGGLEQVLLSHRSTLSSDRNTKHPLHLHELQPSVCMCHSFTLVLAIQETSTIGISLSLRICVLNNQLSVSGLSLNEKLVIQRRSNLCLSMRHPVELLCLLLTEIYDLFKRQLRFRRPRVCLCKGKAFRFWGTGMHQRKAALFIFALLRTHQLKFHSLSSHSWVFYTIWYWY